MHIDKKNVSGCFMEDFKNTIGKITKTLTKTSGDLVKTTKLTVSLASEEDNLKTLYIEIGKKVHEIYTYGGTLGKFFDEKNLELVEIENKIKELKKELDIVRGTKTCSSCGKTMDGKADFCPKCGLNSSTSKPIQNNNSNEMYKEPIIKNNEPLKKCFSCGHEENTNSNYCLACGRKYS